MAQLLGKRHDDAEPVVVAARYELQRKIGAGGYGTVYEAEDRQLRRRVALKVLELEGSDLATREGQLLAQLDHANVVTIFDHGVGPDYRYLAMQLLEGPGLRRACAGMSPAQTIAKYVEAGRGLAAIHARGLVHRDFKPSNVRIGPLGQAVVVDFGLARHLDTLEADPRELGVFVGTIDYAPPERLLGYPGDHRSDQFSFCVALWEALSGVSPWPCSGSTTCEQRILAFGADIVGTPGGGWRVEEALRRGLSLEPADRYPDMAGLLAELAPARRWTRRDLLLAAVPAVFVAAVMTQLMPSPAGGASSEFVANAHVSCLGSVALVMAREGRADAALMRLEWAKPINVSVETSRGLAITSGHVALEFERSVALYPDAADAWHLAAFYARRVGDVDLQDFARERGYALGSAIYNSSALKQVTVPSSLQTPSLHQ
ncbi:Serine/threonine kinase PKN8 [Enhygromyxa salina]|uniref:Serine/threonine kinase PKN8 n=1 Tax=Enhygromyxa salina TaxID=215803 RepID=A0A0C2A6A2_9BACT|nr:Serine/threonine kinase PKN8 [Enhygromyxa salina]